MCADLAKFHNKQREEDEVKSLAAALQHNPLLKAHLLKEAKTLKAEVLEGYRMVLEQK